MTTAPYGIPETPEAQPTCSENRSYHKLADLGVLRVLNSDPPHSPYSNIDLDVFGPFKECTTRS
jgi:hypothetical protein